MACISNLKASQGLKLQGKQAMSVEEFIIWAYCCVDLHISELRQQHPWRSRGFTPRLSDAEIITMELVGEFLGQDTDKGIWQYFKNHWSHYFPGLGSRSNFAKHASNLWNIKQKIQEKIIEEVNAFKEDVERFQRRRPYY